MVEQEWMKFASTGSVQDYLSYRGHKEAWPIAEDRENRGRSVNRYGTEDSADGHGAASNASGGI